MVVVRVNTPPALGAAPPRLQNQAMELQGVRTHLCLGIAPPSAHPPLRRFGFRTGTIDRWTRQAAYVADRTSQVPHYRALFRRHTPLAGKVVVDLGCDEGAILDELRRM